MRSNERAIATARFHHAGAAAWPLAAGAQPAKKILRLGVSWPNPPATFDFMRQGLKDFGYVEGQNIAFEFRSPNWLLCGIRQIRRTNRRCRPSMPRADLYRAKLEVRAASELDGAFDMIIRERADGPRKRTCDWRGAMQADIFCNTWQKSAFL